MTLALVIIEEQRIVSVNGRRLLGECRRCGACCRATGCTHIVQDEVLEDGSRPWRCDIYHTRPMGCALWPLPDQVREDCGFHYQGGEG
jgi:Fe-S-cluster containining protein